MLGKGGEGAVYEVQGATTAAKIYRDDLRRERAPKIDAMVRFLPSGLGPVVAWPVDTLSLRNGRQPVGLLMPKISGKKDVHHVYGPKSRLKDFPRADWRFLVRTAANIARAFAIVHDAKCVIGDVNERSIMVAQDATVTLIDCDSFQVETPSRKFLCEVGVETFTPPELQGKPFRGVTRTPNSDSFGLAIIIFQLLFMGRHPFAGRYLGVGEMPIGKAIKECRFPYSAQNRALQMEPPPGTPPLPFAGADVAHLMERAFSSASIASGRPSAREWASALTSLEKNARQCSLSRSHWFPSHTTKCPWCEMEGQGARPLFPFVLPTAMTGGGGADVEALARTLQSLGDPGPTPSFSIPDPAPSQNARAIGKPNSSSTTVAGLTAAGVFVIGMSLKPTFFILIAIAAVIAYFVTKAALSKDGPIEGVRKQLAEAETAVNVAQQDWNRRASGGVFYEAQAEFLMHKAKLDAVPKKRLAALDALKAEQRKRQLDRFLENFELEDARIDGIGAGRKRVLESYGIEAADDIVVGRLRAVPGFGPKMIGRLMDWRSSCEAKFIFDATKAIDPRDIGKVEQEILTLRNQILTSLLASHTKALQAHAEVMRTRQSMKGPIEELVQKLAQARADYNFVKSS
jgi:DNA-binding helix-hairpin-helix protein with protein kinase domain